VLIAYGFVNPLAVNLEFNGMSKFTYYQSIATSVNGFAGGMAPVMAVEMARRGLGDDVRPSAEELESMLRTVTAEARP